MEPTKHLIGRLREALAEDPRTHALDIQITIAAGKVFLIGQVSSAKRRAAVEEVARELLPRKTVVVNEIWVAHYEEPTETERLP